VEIKVRWKRKEFCPPLRPSPPTRLLVTYCMVPWSNLKGTVYDRVGPPDSCHKLFQIWFRMSWEILKYNSPFLEYDTHRMIIFKLGNALGMGHINPRNNKQNPKGIIQRILTGVETRIIPSMLLNWRPTHFSFWILKRHHHKRSIKPFSTA
jgi:hypothetical protein